MSRKAQHNHKIRARILVAAGETFRRQGYEGARIDAIMEGAGLTRGGFYAHFPSKAALLPRVIAEDDLLLNLLRGRSDAAPDALALGLCDIFRRLLSPELFLLIRCAWTLPALARDASLGEATARDAYETTAMDILEEMARGYGRTETSAHHAVLAQACGAITLASAMHTEAVRDTILRAARDTTQKLLTAELSTTTGLEAIRKSAAL